MQDGDDTTRGKKDFHRRAEEPLRPQTSSPERLSAAAASLSQEPEKYRLLAENAPWGITIIGSAGQYKYLNPKFIEIFGYTLDDIPTGREWFAKAYPDAAYRRQAISEWKVYLQEPQVGEAKPRTFTVTCKDGSVKVVKFRAVPIEGGERFLLCEDITEHLQAEEALKESELKYRTLVEQIPAITYVAALDDCSTTLYVSPQIESILNFSPTDHEADPNIWAKQLHPEDRERVLAEVERCHHTGEPFVCEYRMLARDGRIVWFRDEARLVNDASGRHLFLQGVMLDITKRKQAEEALLRRKAVLEAVSFAAEKFLRAPGWENSIQEILGRLGQAIEASRVHIFENHEGPDGLLLATQRYEWVAPGITSPMPYPHSQGVPYKTAGFQRWDDLLAQGTVIVGDVDEFPASEQKLLTAQEVKSIIAIPIFVGPTWWGFVYFAECLRKWTWSSIEIDALLTATRTLGAAILHAQSERALRESEEKLRSLSYQLLDAQENERKRIATELHDGLGHDLLLLKLKLESLQKKLSSEQASPTNEVRQIIRVLQESVKNVRRLYQDMSPGDLEDLGLTTVLHILIEDFAEAKRLDCQVQLDNLDALFELPLQTTIYRLVQEGLTNIGKHAKAKHVSFRAQKKRRGVAFTIEDDGQGFNLSNVLAGKKTMGLLSMEERVKTVGGSIEIHSQRNAGTRISFTIPFQEGDN